MTANNHEDSVQTERVVRLRDVQISQSLDYPTVDVNIDREKRVSAERLFPKWCNRLWPPHPPAASSFPTSGRRQECIRVSGTGGDSSTCHELHYRPGDVPVERYGARQLLLRDVAQVKQRTMTGQFDRYNMKRELS